MSSKIIWDFKPPSPNILGENVDKIVEIKYLQDEQDLRGERHDKLDKLRRDSQEKKFLRNFLKYLLSSRNFSRSHFWTL